MGWGELELLKKSKKTPGFSRLSVIHIPHASALLKQSQSAVKAVWKVFIYLTFNLLFRIARAKMGSNDYLVAKLIF